MAVAVAVAVVCVCVCVCVCVSILWCGGVWVHAGGIHGCSQ